VEGNENIIEGCYEKIVAHELKHYGLEINILHATKVGSFYQHLELLDSDIMGM
jgi:uncharacterized protein (DUF488 family)